MNYTSTEEKIKVLDLQMLASSVFIITVLISIFITYNEEHFLRYNERILEASKAATVVKINRIVVLIVILCFLYVNYKTREFDERNGRNTTPDQLEIVASYCSLIGALIILYVVFKYSEDSITITENPNE